MRKFFLTSVLFIATNFSFAQYKSGLSKNEWVDSVFRALDSQEKIAQLLVIRALPNDTGISKTADLIHKFNVGAICFFQGGPIRQVNATNYYQSIAKTPLMITTDAEWGLGMRLDSVNKFPY